MTKEEREILEELKTLKEQMNNIYSATLQASTIVLPYEYYTEEQKS